mmetsp:Transcript_7637/g.17993  ORF Transcript_7637/g.17993 Transcript_7637/m.17993 type:complete len:524 (+) Transcript_7637:93-1664(+)
MWGIVTQCLDHSDDSIIGFDLRFKDRRIEASFKASVEPEVLRFGVLLSVCCVVLVPVSLIPVYFEEVYNEKNPFDLWKWDVRTLMLVLWLCCFSNTFLFSTFGLLRIWRNWFSSWNWEGHFMVMITYYAVSLAFANFWHLPLICHQHPSNVWVHDARGAEVFILLALDGIMTVVAMYIPIRSCTLWILPLCGVGSYFFMLVVVDSIFPSDRFKSISALLFLTIFACHGAYRNEQHRREKWIALQQVMECTEVVKQQETQIQETAALVKGLRTVASALCDIIVKLTEDLRVCGAEPVLDSFFEQAMDGKMFVEVLGAHDSERFKALVSTVSSSQVHACMPVTIRKMSSLCEAHLLLVDTGRTMPRYFIGIRVEMEHLDGGVQEAEQADSAKADGPENFCSVVPSPASPSSGRRPGSRAEDKESDFSFTTWPKQGQNVPVLAYTSVRARAISMRKVMPRWNIPRDLNSCCQFHTVVDSIHEVADFLSEKPCEPLWSTLNGGQCARCKSMCAQPRIKCVVCGYMQQ